MTRDGNRFEWKVRTALTRQGMRFEVDKDTLLGTPDIVFPVDKIAVFLDGCFWHGCVLHRGAPRRIEFWAKTWAETQKRDALVTTELMNDGWTVLRYWEHDSVDEIARDVAELRELRNRTRLREL